MLPVIEIGNIQLYTFPFIAIISIYSCIAVFVFSKKYEKLYWFVVKKLMFYGLVGAGIGGKLLYFITQLGKGNISLYGLLGGFVFWGGFIGSVIGVGLYCKTKFFRFADLMDVYASILPLGQAMGRLGCYLNGCCYGKEYVGWLSVEYIVDGKLIRVFPTWFVESGFCFAIFALFFKISKEKFRGFYISLYLILYSSFRIVIENFRGDTIRGIWWGISTSQYISVLAFICGIVSYIIAKTGNKTNFIIVGR